ncbi:mycofactocin biosynthesis glycosyltransferase MftF [Microbacterium sp.]|uniref:mycofactocin biosynthesis glycosyltransferase MftF n=1 Tax=Microbacterium sp. TaxID=51671 RepID=UPI0025D605E1|nr:mycofactocin biosynthesis glycosyltransferase MftF [Microbacterium sp.]
MTESAIGGVPASAGLPDGFTVRLNRRTRVLGGGGVLVGGSPTRVARLKPAAAGLIDDGTVTVHDTVTRALAEHLLSVGMAEPVVSSLPRVPLTEATVVIPVRDRARQLARLLASLPAGIAVVVVDDASLDPAAVASVVRAHGATLVPLTANRGVAGARNAGLETVTTPYVAFIDSDVVVEPGSIEMLLRHFADPAVGMVAPRILGLDAPDLNWITRYENARSSLDLGRDAAAVRPRSPLTWVSGTCQVCRVAAMGTGYDGSMDAGEDVDMVWRLVAAGHRVRFEPAASMRHEHRSTLRTWLGRKYFYGTGAQPLAERHPRDVAPVVLPPWAVGVLVALFAQRRWSIPVVGVISAAVTWRIARRLGHVPNPVTVAARLTRDGLLAAIAQGFALLLRHWWPLTAIALPFSRRARRAVLVAAVADTVWEYARVRPQLDPARFAVARRLDDIAYGAGVWWGALRGRSALALLPAIVRTGTAPSRDSA